MLYHVYRHIASKLDAMQHCRETGNHEWLARHRDAIQQIVADRMPSGSGVDNGTKLDFDRSSADKLVFTMSYHHMDSNGYYAGWTDHTCIVRPSLALRFTVTITGKDRNDIKHYLADIYRETLDTEIDA